jgi:hypothetical protein
MNLLKRLFGGSAARGSDSEDSNALIYYVKGHKCGAITRVRIDKRNDLSRDDDDTLFVHKVIIDSKCYGQVEIDLRFDENFNETSREIKGGEFVTREAWDAQSAQSESTSASTPTA